MNNTLSDIYESSPVNYGDGWELRHLWFNSDGTWTTSDESGDHNDLTDDEAKEFCEKVEENNDNYARSVLETNEEPLNLYSVRTQKDVTAGLTVYFRRWIGERDKGLCVTSVRVLTGKHKGVYSPDETPNEIADYLCLKELKLCGRWVIDGLTKDDIREADECSYVGNEYFKCRAEWKEPLAESTIRRQLRFIARKTCKK